MLITFYKYQGTGNDFIMIDNRSNNFPKNNTKLVSHLCDRKFGIGADGLILLENDATSDFKMVYYNADGNESTMCGNGGRCLVAFANFLDIINTKTTFTAIDGLHYAEIDGVNVKLQMQNVTQVEVFENYTFLDTGSPHHVQKAVNLANFDVKTNGAKLRYGKYGEKGSNINFVEKEDVDTFSVRTYERGVEDETLSCGTGVTAVAIAMSEIGEANGDLIQLNTLGGLLKVSFTRNGEGYKNIFLEGPAQQVFKGSIKW